MHRSIAALILSSLACSAMTACASSRLVGVERPESSVAWPPGDASPRIEVLFTYTGTDRAQAGRGFFASLGDFFAGSETFQFVSPYGIAGTLRQRLYIADPGLAAVHVVDFVAETHSLLRGSSDSPMITPVGAALGPDGQLYVTDSSAGCVHVFDRDGDYLRRFGGPDEFGRPTGIVYDARRGRLLLADTTGGRILSYSPAGELLGVHGERGEERGLFNYPTNLGLAPDGRVVVVDTMNFRIQVLTPELEPESAFGLAGDGPGHFARPKGIGLDSEGHIYVVDAMFDNVQVFDFDGQLLLTFGTKGGGFGNLFLPSGVLIDDEDHVIVADSGNARLQVFKYHPQQR